MMKKQARMYVLRRNVPAYDITASDSRNSYQTPRKVVSGVDMAQRGEL